VLFAASAQGEPFFNGSPLKGSITISSLISSISSISSHYFIKISSKFHNSNIVFFAGAAVNRGAGNPIRHIAISGMAERIFEPWMVQYLWYNNLLPL
jgi:hypothetical protein